MTVTLDKKPQIVVANKMDDEYSELHLEEFKKKYPQLKIYEISALEKEGIGCSPLRSDGHD
jgi:GTP-binding protein